MRFLGSYCADLSQKVEHYLEAVGCGGSIPSISIVLLGKIITTTDAGVLANNPNRGAYDDRHIKG